MTQDNKTKKKKRLSPIMGIGLLLIVSLLAFNGYTLAKYIFGHEQEAVFVAKDFYFESDLLKSTDVTIPQYILQTGVNDITFVLKNHPDELRTSEVDIAYSVTLKKDGDSNPVTKTGTLEIDEKNETIYFDNLAPGTYTVTAEATAPYAKTLRAEFVVTGMDNNIRWKVNDNAQSPFLQLIVQTADSDGDILISWPNGVVPDNTDALLAGAISKAGDDENYPVSMQANAEYAFVFFKEDPDRNYSTDDFATVGTNNTIHIVEKTA